MTSIGLIVFAASLIFPCTAGAEFGADINASTSYDQVCVLLFRVQSLMCRWLVFQTVYDLVVPVPSNKPRGERKAASPSSPASASANRALPDVDGLPRNLARALLILSDWAGRVIFNDELVDKCATAHKCLFSLS